MNDSTMVPRLRGWLVATVLGVYAVLVGVEPAVAQSSPEAWLYAGSEKARRGDSGGAIADYTRAIELEPRLAEAHSLRCAAKQHARDVDGAIADCNRAIELDAKLDIAYGNRGNARQTKGDLTDQCNK